MAAPTTIISWLLQRVAESDTDSEMDTEVGAPEDDG
jgi:hypothetical protein